MVGEPSYLGVATGDWVAALKSSDPLERRLAAHALAEIGPAAREAVPALTKALRDPESFVRMWGPLRWRESKRRTPTPSPFWSRGRAMGYTSFAVWLRGTWGASGRDTLQSRSRYRSCASCSMTMTRACAPRRWWRWGTSRARALRRRN